MISFVRGIVREQIPLHIRKWLRDRSYYRDASLSFSQEGEDMLLQGYLGYERGPGFYVDIGAHHPLRFSNTYNLYRQGWRGICIDPMSEYLEEFARYRPEDVFLNLGISRCSQNLTLHIFEYPECNTFSVAVAAEHESEGLLIKGRRKIQCYPLSEILDQNRHHFSKIDFMNIDVEGLDLEVLQSNNWERYSPELLLIETHTDTLQQVLQLDAYKLLSQLGYQCVAKLRMSLLFRRGSGQ